MWLFVFLGSSSWCCGLVCSVIVIFPDHAKLLLHAKYEAENGNFAYKYSKGLDVPYVHLHLLIRNF